VADCSDRTSPSPPVYACYTRLVKVLDGRALRDSILESLRPRIATLSRPPCLALVCNTTSESQLSPSDRVYARNKIRAADALGIRVVVGTAQDLPGFNLDPAIDAILVQMPLTEPLPCSVSADKDADGCTPDGIVALLRHYQIPISGARTVVVGRNHFMGRPIAVKMLDADATVTICHSKTRDLAAECRRAEILISATAQPGLITKAHVAPDAVVVDVGTALVDGNFVGDLAPDAAEMASAAALVPGGVGPMTIAMLLSKTVELAERHACRK
jgi:methylenetetrahydrofolate dehydrogenase (NADP+) / methenyltetrahydrofolate cyclohydrolase